MPEASFGILDWIVVLIYTLVVTGVGVFVARGQKSKRDYFLGGREMVWWAVGLSIIATETSALTFIGIPVESFGSLKIDADGQYSVAPGNLFFMMLMAGYLLGRIIIAWKIIPLYYKGDVYTPYQLLSRAFGPSARYAASGLQLIGIALGAGVRVYVTAIPITIVMQTSFPQWGVLHSITAIMLVALLYTAVGGIKAVVWTEMIQYFIFIGGGLFALFYVPFLLTGDNAAPSGATGWAAVFETSKDHLNWFNLGLNFSDGIGGFFYTLFCEDYNLLMGIFPGTLGIVLAFGFDQLNVQRILGCKNEKESRKAMILSAVLIVPQFLLFLMIGAVLYSFYKLNNFSFGLEPWDPGAEIQDETGYPKPNASFVFPIFIVTRMPIIFKGFLIAAILAAAMSSVSSAISAMASMITMDFYRPMAGKLQNLKTEMRLSRTMAIASGIVLGIIALACKGSEQIVDLAFTLAGLTGGGILGIFAYGIMHKKGHPVPVIIGLICSFIFMGVLNLMMNPEFIPMIPRPFEIPYILWPWHPLIGMTVCFIGIYSTLPLFPSTEDRDISRIEEDDKEQTD